MVKLEEVQDEELDKPQEGPIDDEGEWDTDDESDIADEDLSAPDDETILDRLYALKDIVPPSQRRQISNIVSTGGSWLQTGVSFGGKALWVVSTSALLLGVPWALAYAEEQQMIEMEREMKMQQQANEVLTAQGAGAQQGAAKPAL